MPSDEPNIKVIENEVKHLRKDLDAVDGKIDAVKKEIYKYFEPFKWFIYTISVVIFTGVMTQLLTQTGIL